MICIKMDDENLVFELDLDYNEYTKLLIEHIVKELDIIFDVFDEDNNTNLIKLLIINKKLITNDNKYIINLLETLITNLNYILNNSIDQKDYLKIMLNLLNIFTTIDKTNVLQQELDLCNIDFKFINFYNNLSTLFETIRNNNTLFNCLCNIVENEKLILKNIKDPYVVEYEKIIQNNVTNIATMLAKDYFIHCNSNEILKILYDETLIVNNNFIPYVLIKNNKLFQDKYILYYQKYCKIYKNEKTKIAKFKYVLKNDEFNNLLQEIKNIEYI